MLLNAVYVLPYEGRSVSKRGLALQIVVSYEKINCDDRDLPGITKDVKQLTEKDRIYRNFVRLKCIGMGKNVSNFERFNTLQDKLNFLIAESKKKNYAKIDTRLATSKNVNLESLLYCGKILLLQISDKNLKVSILLLLIN